MMCEEDKRRYLKASTCDDCIGWHSVCDAECCKVAFLDIDPKLLDKPGKYITIHPATKLSLDEQWYYKLRDVEYVRGKLRFLKYRVQLCGTRIVYIYTCQCLENNLCTIHNGVKPNICKDLDSSSMSEYPDKTKSVHGIITDNCLYKYKMEE